MVLVISWCVVLLGFGSGTTERHVFLIIAIFVDLKTPLTLERPSINEISTGPISEGEVERDDFAVVSGCGSIDVNAATR
jgi:hypothetical protein